jgi:hypothetical protein
MTRATGLLLIALGVLVLTPAGPALSQLAAQSGAPVDGFTEPEDDGNDDDDCDDDDDDEADGDCYVIAQNPNPPESDGPELTSAQRERAIALALGDYRVKNRLTGKPHYVESSGPWSTGGATNTLVGAIVIIRLTSPANFPPNYWPVIAYDGREDTSYSETSMFVSAQNVTELVVSVDLARSLVVAIEPDGDDARITAEQECIPTRPLPTCYG